MGEYRKLKSLKFLYEINEHGVLRNVKSKRVISGYIESNGYVRVKLENKCLGGVIRTTIHRLVAEAFIPNPDNLPVVNHKDLNKLNNHVSNLEWATQSGNMKHAYENGAVNISPLLKHSSEARTPISNGERVFDSRTSAAKWLAETGRMKNFDSAMAGISQVLRKVKNKRTCGGYPWYFV